MSLTLVTHTARDIIDHVQRQFGDEAGVQVTEQDIIRWINQGQVEILNKNPVLQAQAVTDVVAGQAVYESPEMLHMQSLFYNGRPLERMSFQEAQQYIIGYDPQKAARGEPIIWYEYGGAFNIYPIPAADLANGLVVFYVQMPKKITTALDSLSLPDRYYNTLFNYVMAQAYEQDDDWTGKGNKLSEFEANINVLAEEEDNVSHNTYATITVLPEDM